MSSRERTAVKTVDPPAISGYTCPNICISRYQTRYRASFGEPISGISRYRPIIIGVYPISAGEISDIYPDIGKFPISGHTRPDIWGPNIWKYPISGPDSDIGSHKQCPDIGYDIRIRTSGHISPARISGHVKNPDENSESLTRDQGSTSNHRIRLQQITVTTVTGNRTLERIISKSGSNYWLLLAIIASQ